MPLCIVDGCPNRSYKKSARQLEVEKELGRTISFHKFPADVHLRSLWLKAIKQPEIDPDRSKICCQHFVPDQLECNPQFILVKPNAVPSVFPGLQHQNLRSCTQQYSFMLGQKVSIKLHVRALWQDRPYR
nr:PREDICTED: THAP domain-containing protein 1-like [Bemisia tabaci]XP_018910713.1 PREDICTED: THAP domain-containing protein 1-like [Bemisia tabaci]